jgi:hypothetical protein
MNISDTGSQAATITTLSDALLTSLTLSGSSAVNIGTLTDTAATITISNTGSATDEIGTSTTAGFTSATATSLTLKGNVALGSNDGIAAHAANLGTINTGITVAGSTDNAHVNIDISTGAAAASTDTISLGNANNQITDASSAGVVKVTVGTGSNLIDLHTGSASTYAATVTLGAHNSGGPDKILVGVVAASATTANTTITGAVTGDMIGIADATSVVALTSAQQTTVSAETSLANAVAYVDGASVALGAHAATAFTYGANTYVLETVAGGATNAGTMAAGNTLITLVGTHTLTAGAVTGVVTLAS